MAFETTIPQDDSVFEDSFALDGVSLSDIFLERIHSTYDRAADEQDVVIEPVTAFSPPPTDALLSLTDRWYDLGRGMWVKPESFHQAFDMDAKSADEVIETATEHYQKLRDLGIRVVGHMFEAIDNEDPRFISNPRYPTILTGAKFPIRDRPSDVPEDDDHWLTGKKLSKEYAEELGLDLQKALLEPVHAYYDWCEASDQSYVLGGLEDFFGYAYHPRERSILLEGVSTKMGNIALGNLRFARDQYEFLAQSMNTST